MMRNHRQGRIASHSIALVEKVKAVSGGKGINTRLPLPQGKKALIFRGLEALLFLRIAPVFPRPQLLALAFTFLGAGRTIKAVGPPRRKQFPTLPAAPRPASLHDFGIKGRVQRQDGGLEPPAQQRIGNALHTDTFLPIVQQEAVPVTVIAALMR